MKTLMETIAELDSRLNCIEGFLGLTPQPKVKVVYADRKLLPVKPKSKAKSKVRQHANKKEGQQIRQEIVAFLKTRTKPTAKDVIGRQVRVKSSGALGWYLKSLCKADTIKMVGHGKYQVKE